MCMPSCKAEAQEARSAGVVNQRQATEEARKLSPINEQAAQRRRMSDEAQGRSTRNARSRQGFRVDITTSDPEYWHCTHSTNPSTGARVRNGRCISSFIGERQESQNLSS